MRHQILTWWISTRQGDRLRSSIRVPQSRPVQRGWKLFILVLSLSKHSWLFLEFGILAFNTFFDGSRGHMYVLSKIARLVTGGRTIWPVIFFNTKGKLLDVQLRIAIVTLFSKQIWQNMSKLLNIPPKVRSSMFALKVVVERFSNLHQSYKSMRILMASFFSFDHPHFPFDIYKVTLNIR